jgi:hypothetical protein
MKPCQVISGKLLLGTKKPLQNIINDLKPLQSVGDLKLRKYIRIIYPW